MFVRPRKVLFSCSMWLLLAATSVFAQDNIVAADTSCLKRACEIHAQVQPPRKRSATTIVVVKMMVDGKPKTYITANPGAGGRKKKKPLKNKPKQKKGEKKTDYEKRCKAWEDEKKEYARKLAIFNSPEPKKKAGESQEDFDKRLAEWKKCQKDFDSKPGWPDSKEAKELKKKLMEDVKRTGECLICDFSGFKYDYNTCCWPHAEDVIEAERKKTGGKIIAVGICRGEKSCDFTMCKKCQGKYGDKNKDWPKPQTVDKPKPKPPKKPAKAEVIERDQGYDQEECDRLNSYKIAFDQPVTVGADSLLVYDNVTLEAVEPGLICAVVDDELCTVTYDLSALDLQPGSYSVVIDAQQILAVADSCPVDIDADGEGGDIFVFEETVALAGDMDLDLYVGFSDLVGFVDSLFSPDESPEDSTWGEGDFDHDDSIGFFMDGIMLLSNLGVGY